MFDGKQAVDVTRFFFVYESVVMRGKSDGDKTGEFLCYLQGYPFEFYYDTYSRNVKLTDEAGNYQAVKKAMIDRSESVAGSECGIIPLRPRLGERRRL